VTRFFDIGHNVKIRLEPYQVLRSDLDPVEIELLAYRLRSAGQDGEAVEGTALKQITFPSNRHGRWHVVYFMLPHSPVNEIFIVSISPEKLVIAAQSKESALLNHKTVQIALTAIRIIRTIGAWTNY
jgi:hypothetical protein